MSPNNRPRLRPSRPFITSILIGEGETEGAFLCHLKMLYDSRSSGIQVKVDWTYGGSPKDIIEDAVKIKQAAEYDRAVLMIDQDVPILGESVEMAKKESIDLVLSQPCVEGLFLKILNPIRDWSKSSSK